MAQWFEMALAKPGDLDSSPRAHMVAGKKEILGFVLRAQPRRACT